MTGELKNKGKVVKVFQVPPEHNNTPLVRHAGRLYFKAIETPLEGRGYVATYHRVERVLQL